MNGKVIIPELDEILEKELKVLDHGFIRAIDYMGGDSSIVQSARVSYGRGTKTSLEDEALIRYLMRHNHSTPFESLILKLHIKCPIFVARQWMRHRTLSYNEYSARYSIVDDKYYTPETDRMTKQSLSNKQGSDSGIIDNPEELIDSITIINDIAYTNYKKALDKNLSREIARISLPQSMYTEFYVNASAHNWFHFCRLRSDNHAQYEIKVYSDIILHQIIAIWIPMAYRAFLDYRMNARTFSAPVLELMKRKLSGEKILQENSNLTKREWMEIADLLEL